MSLEQSAADCPLGENCTSCPLPGSSLADEFVPLSDGNSLNLAVQDASATEARAPENWQQGLIVPSGGAHPSRRLMNGAPDANSGQAPAHGFASFHELLNHALASHLHTNKEQASMPLASAKAPVPGQETQCQWEGCHFQGEAISTLQEHLVAAHGDWCSQLPERVVVCRWGCCRRFFTDKTKFAHHMCTHSGMRFYQCEEANCEHGFTSESQRRAHVRRHHEKSFKCDICATQGTEKGYSSGFNLREHVRIVHEKKSLICNVCGRAYQSHKAWSAHQRSCQASAPLQDRRNAQLTGMQPY